MTCAIIGFIISYLFVKLTVGNSVDINGKSAFTLTEKLQASFLIFLFAGYWIVLLAKYLISLIYSTMNTTESPKRKISALERTIVAGMGSITMPDMMTLYKKFPTLAIEDIYDILSSIETSALGTTSREFILQYAEVRLLSLRKSKIIEEATEQTREISEKVQALISRNEELNDRLERQTSYIGKLQQELSTFKSVNKNIKIVSLVLLFLLIGQIIAHFTL